jgi:hypothetical protein
MEGHTPMSYIALKKRGEREGKRKKRGKKWERS